MEMTSMYACVQKCTPIDDDAVVKGMTYFLTEFPTISATNAYGDDDYDDGIVLKSEFFL